MKKGIHIGDIVRWIRPDNNFSITDHGMVIAIEKGYYEHYYKIHWFSDGAVGAVYEHTKGLIEKIDTNSHSVK